MVDLVCPSSLKVGVVGARPLFRWAVQQLLIREPDIATPVIGENGADLRETLRSAGDAGVDIVILDFGAGSGSPVEAVRDVRSLGRVLAVSESQDGDEAISLLKAGARGSPNGRNRYWASSPRASPTVRSRPGWG